MVQDFEKSLHHLRLQFLKGKRFDPKVIYDIGAYRGYWSIDVKRIFPQAKIFLFEANENYRRFLEKLPYPVFYALLGDKEQMVTFYMRDSTGDSIFREQTKFYQGSNFRREKLPMTTLTQVVEKNQIPLPDLIKIDVQGAEKLIIQGGLSVIAHAEAVILETKILEYNKKAPLMYETLSLMEAIGYSVQDILECHYLPSGELNEVDFLFLKKDSTLIKKGILIKQSSEAF